MPAGGRDGGYVPRPYSLKDHQELAHKSILILVDKGMTPQDAVFWLIDKVGTPHAVDMTKSQCMIVVAAVLNWILGGGE